MESASPGQPFNHPISNPSSTAIGEIFHNRYQIQELLGRHTGRRTYLAHDLKTQQLVVVKRLSFGEDFEWSDLKRFEREAEVLQALSHPAIPRYLDHFDLDLPTGKGFALVQTYIPARSLAQHLQAGRCFLESELVELAKAILDILLYLHERFPAVIHRDIKPSNILLSDHGNSLGQVYLVDFGAVQTLAAQQGATITVVGTYGYMPPEQFGGRSVPASDLYSLGATLIHLLTGQAPADLPQRDQTLQFDKYAQVSPAFSHWLKQMLQPALERRFTTARQALKALDHPPQSAITPPDKPTNSKVILHKDRNTLEILLPPGRTNPGVIGGAVFMAAFAIAWNSFLIMWTGFALMAPLPINLVFSLFSLPFWLAGISMVVGVLFALFGRVRLRLDSEQIRQDYELFGLKKAVIPPSQRPLITQLEWIPRHYKKDADGDRIQVHPKILITAGSRSYEVGGNGLLSDLELKWLASELSDWLNLSLLEQP